MMNKKVESFLEKNNMDYLFCMLSNLEVERINKLPTYVKQKFEQKITELAMEHVAENIVPDYIIELAEAELAMAQQSSPFEDDEEDNDLNEDAETIDDSKHFIEEIEDDDDGFDDDDADEIENGM
ncbi:MAG: hypothetical protein PHI68_00485 [Candidatus Cloacimonetes bacterium]|nr:hypothetical protein [Candidatus Cloacimonadota bacterium]